MGATGGARILKLDDYCTSNQKSEIANRIASDVRCYSIFRISDLGRRRHPISKFSYLPLLALLLLVTISSAQDQIQVGYTLISPDAGASPPAAAALFTYTNAQGVPVSQAGVEATEPILSGRVFIDENDTRTGLALVNPSSGSAMITMVLRDASGTEFARSMQALPAGQHLARYVAELFPAVP